MKTWSWTWSRIAVALALAACATDSPRTTEDRGVADEELERALAEAEPVPVDGPVVQEPGSAPFDPSWPVSETGFGPIHAGMSMDEVAEAVAGAIEVPEELGGCDYISPRGWPEGVSVMVVEGRVARVDIWKEGIATSEGARIGSTEQEVHALYPGQVETRPHKYTDGRYLIVTPAGTNGTEHRIVFETDGEEVERYRAGALPAVEWVEGCA